MLHMAKLKNYTFSLRIPETTLAQVERIAQEVGYSDSRLMNLFIDAMLNMIEKGDRNVPQIVRFVRSIRENNASMIEKSMEPLFEGHQSKHSAKKKAS